jgi:hypothetical protein
MRPVDLQGTNYQVDQVDVEEHTCIIVYGMIANQSIHPWLVIDDFMVTGNYEKIASKHATVYSISNKVCPGLQKEPNVR